MPYTIQQHLMYNVWANTRLTDSLRPVDENILYAPMKSSFPGIAKTLLHIWDAETVWLKRLQGESPSSWHSAGFSGGKEDLLEGLVQTSRDLADWVSSKDKEIFSNPLRYHTVKGDYFETDAELVFHHLVNHSTYHRGQIVTLLREAGITGILSTDLIAYSRL